MLEAYYGLGPDARQCVTGLGASAHDAVVGLVVQEPDDHLLDATVRADVEIGPKNLQLSAAEVAQRVESLRRASA
jgi:energy-coupling factor transporter ATP-binding protein EcfA2